MLNDGLTIKTFSTVVLCALAVYLFTLWLGGYIKFRAEIARQSFTLLGFRVDRVSFYQTKELHIAFFLLWRRLSITIEGL